MNINHVPLRGCAGGVSPRVWRCRGEKVGSPKLWNSLIKFKPVLVWGSPSTPPAQTWLNVQSLFIGNYSYKTVVCHTVPGGGTVTPSRRAGKAGEPGSRWFGLCTHLSLCLCPCPCPSYDVRALPLHRDAPGQEQNLRELSPCRGPSPSAVWAGRLHVSMSFSFSHTEDHSSCSPGCKHPPAGPLLPPAVTHGPPLLPPKQKPLPLPNQLN